MRLTFTSNEVVALTGISPRQLQWWDEQGIVVAAREGHRRIYSVDDLAEMAVLSELRRRGFSLQKIRRVLRFVQKELGKRLVETVTAASEYHLLTDGHHIYLEDSARGVVDLLKNARQPMLSVCLSDAIQRVLWPVEGASSGSAQPVAASRLGSESPQRRPPVRIVAHAAAKQNGSVRHLNESGSKPPQSAHKRRAVGNSKAS
jgi:DNA-binding transcriptional MerR regulator